MYWYVSFLRPPPVSTEIGSSITITPQVANDLRTELRYEPTEIHYYWRRTEHHLATTAAVHLTSFIPPESTYRPLTIPLPAQAGIGEKWQLCLFASDTAESKDGPTAAGGQDILALTGSSSGCVPLSVYSEAIEIIRPNPAAGGGVTKGVGANGKGKGKGKEKDDGRDKSKRGKERDESVKQTRIMREWATPEGGSLKIVEQTSFDLDKKIWDSGLALSSWLYRHLQPDESRDSVSEHTQAKAEEVLDLLRSTRGSHDILELGSGTGLVSIALRSILAQQDGACGRIVATDLESAIDLMSENMSRNYSPGSEDEPLRLKAEVLDWDQPLPEWVGEAEDGSWPNLIIAADVTYNTASFPCLIRTLKALLLPPNTAHRPRLLLAYKQRDPGERELWGMLEKEGVGMVLVESIAGAENDGAVEIWVSA